MRFIATVCAAIAVGFALTGHATNILTNPGFDQSSATFTGWTLNSAQTWQANVVNTLYLSSPNSLIMQGVYWNTYWNSAYLYQKIASAPGYTYTADAWFSQFVSNAPAGEGGDDYSGGSGLFGNNMDQYSTNTANGSFYEDGWVEVQFLSSSNSILADFKSFIVNPAYVHNLASNGVVSTSGTNVYLTWFDVLVTNQYNPNTIVADADPDQTDTSGAALTPGPTNSIPNGIMTAPPGTEYVQFSLNLFQNNLCSGAPHWDNCTLNQLSGFQPATISNLTPNGTKLFNIANTNFTCNVSASLGTTVASNAIDVVENGVDVSKNLKFSGNSANWNVTLPGLTSNSIYRMSITVNNSAGLISTAGASFDTFNPSNFVVAAEDYNFNGGSFIQNPIPTNSPGPNTYFGTLGVSGADYEIYSGGALPGNGNNLIPAYPDRNTDTAWQVASDPNLPLYIAQSNSAIYNVNIAYNNPGNWYMYTRNPYPSGSGYYQVYARMSDGGDPTVGGSETLQLVTSGAGTATFTTTNLGYFVLNGAVPGWTPDWNTYYWVPLGQDASGLNPTVVSMPTGQQTLQLISGNGCNLIDFMFVPIPALGLPPNIKNFNPPVTTPGQNVFVSTNLLTYTVSSLISTVATNNIHTYINGVSVPETFTGNSSNWTVSVPLSSVANQLAVTVSVSAVDNNGLTNGVSATFDTFGQNNFMIEAVDWDFNGGEFIDNPIPTGYWVGGTTAPYGYTATNSYFYYPAGNSGNAAILGVDYSTPGTDAGETFVYRPAELCGTEVTSDYLRQKFYFTNNLAVVTNYTDFDVGWWDPGTWINYTRTFPTNTYNVYGRLANSGPYSGVTLSLVTGGVGTSNQTTSLLGTFSDPNADGYQTWHWVPLLDSNGNPVAVSLGGVKTLKVTTPASSGANGHFYMFVPAAIQSVNVSASISGSNLSLHFATQSGASYTVLYNSSLSGGSWAAVAGPIAGDGTTHTVTLGTSGSVGFYKLLIQ